MSDLSREALIEAVSAAIADWVDGDVDYVAAVATRTALLLTADAIEDPIRLGEAVHYEFCSLAQAGALVRSLGGGQ